VLPTPEWVKKFGCHPDVVPKERVHFPTFAVFRTPFSILPPLTKALMSYEMRLPQACVSSLAERKSSSTHMPGLEAFVATAERVVVDGGRASSCLSKLLVQGSC